VDVYTDYDFDRGINGLQQYRAVILDSHPEYWTLNEYYNLRTYLRSGGNLLYLGGNGIFEMVDDSPDGSAVHFRTMGPTRQDNLFTTLGLPEAALLGVGYLFGRGTPPPAAYTVTTTGATHFFFTGTKAYHSPGQTFGGDGLAGNAPTQEGAAGGWEVDETTSDSPADTLVLATAQSGSCDLVAYETDAGGMVFSVGSLSFAGSLAIDNDLQTVVSNVLSDDLAVSKWASFADIGGTYGVAWLDNQHDVQLWQGSSGGSPIDEGQVDGSPTVLAVFQGADSSGRAAVVWLAGGNIYRYNAFDNAPIIISSTGNASQLVAWEGAGGSTSMAWLQGQDLWLWVAGTGATVDENVPSGTGPATVLVQGSDSSGQPAAVWVANGNVWIFSSTTENNSSGPSQLSTTGNVTAIAAWADIKGCIGMAWMAGQDVILWSAASFSVVANESGPGGTGPASQLIQGADTSGSPAAVWLTGSGSVWLWNAYTTNSSGGPTELSSPSADVLQLATWADFNPNTRQPLISLAWLQSDQHLLLWEADAGGKLVDEDQPTGTGPTLLLLQDTDAQGRAAAEWSSTAGILWRFNAWVGGNIQELEGPHFGVSAPATLPAGQTASVTVTVLDAFGNVATGYTGTVQLTSTDDGAALPNNYTFTSTDQGTRTFSGNDGLILVSPGIQQVTVEDTAPRLIGNNGVENIYFTTGGSALVDVPDLSASVSGPNDGFNGVQGQTRTFAIAASDASFADSAAGFSYEIGWGDGASGTVAEGASNGSGVNIGHTYAVAGTYTIQVTATDQYGGVSASAIITDTILVAEQQGNGLALGGNSSNESWTFAPASATSLTVKLGGKTLGSFTATAGVQLYGQAGINKMTIYGPSAGGASFSVNDESAAMNAFIFNGTSIGGWTFEGKGRNNALTVADVLKTAPVSFAGGAGGNNTLLGPNASAKWTLSAAGRGNIATVSSAGQVSFSQVQNLVGGMAGNVFLFTSTAATFSTINGGSTTSLNWLDYSRVSEPINVNLSSAIFGTVPADSATGISDGIANGIASIANVRAGSGNAVLVGSGGNILVGGGGNNELVDTYSGSSASGASLLIGGSGMETLMGGAAGDILIAGTTTYGSKNINLQDMLAYWDTHDHNAAFTQLQSKTGLPGTKERLYAGSTVTGGNTADVITAANTSAIDWFFASEGATINNGKHGPDYLNNGLY
jgi:hypothetical protein